MTATGKLAAALRAQARGLYAEEAAVELLLTSSVAGRRGFQRQYIDYTDDPQLIGTGEPLAQVQWDRIVADIASGAFPACSSGELQVIQCAAGLAGQGNWPLKDMIDSLGEGNLALVMEAMALLRGWHERALRATIIGDVEGRAS